MGKLNGFAVLLLSGLCSGVLMGQGIELKPIPGSAGNDIKDLRVIQGKVHNVRHPKQGEEWLRSGLTSGGYLLEFRCLKVLKDGIIADGLSTYSGDVPEAQGRQVKVAPFFLRNYPEFKTAAEGDKLRFVALRVGNFEYGDGRIKAFDCGTPYKP